jgi:hypothetical protein
MARLILFFSLVLLTFCTFPRAQNFAELLNTEWKRYVNDFLNSGIGGRSLGMGDAFAAVSGDIANIHKNPAGLADIENHHIGFMHSEIFGGEIKQDFLCFIYSHHRKMTLGTGLLRYSTGKAMNTNNFRVLDNNIPVYPNDDESYRITYYDNTDYAAYFSTAYKILRERLSLGLSIKFIKRYLADKEATGMGADFGAQAKINKQWRLGLQLANATTTVNLWNNETREHALPNLYLGISHFRRIPYFYGDILFAYETVDLMYNEGINSGFRGSGGGGTEDIDLYELEGIKITKTNLKTLILSGKFGLEYRYKKVLSLRGGFSSKYSWTCGAGLKVSGIRTNFNYAFLQHPAFGGSHRVGLSYYFKGKSG